MELLIGDQIMNDHLAVEIVDGDEHETLDPYIDGAVTEPLPLAGYSKAVAFIIAAASTAFVVALADNVVDRIDLVNVGIAVIGAVAVYLVPNLPGGVLAYAKGIVAFLTAAGQALVIALGDQVVTWSDWLTVLVTALGAIGVVIVPNTDPDDTALPALPEAK